MLPLPIGRDELRGALGMRALAFYLLLQPYWGVIDRQTCETGKRMLWHFDWWMAFYFHNLGISSPHRCGQIQWWFVRQVAVKLVPQKQSPISKRCSESSALWWTLALSSYLRFFLMLRGWDLGAALRWATSESAEHLSHVEKQSLREGFKIGRFCFPP